MPEECACEVGVSTQKHRQFTQSCQVLFQWDRNSRYWCFLSSSEKSALAVLHKKNPRESEAGWIAWQGWEERVHAHTSVHVCDGHVRVSPWWMSFFPPNCWSGVKGHCPRSPPRTWPGGKGLAFLSWEVRLFAWAEPDESSITRLWLCLRPLLLKEPTLLFLFGAYFWFENRLKGKPSIFHLPL